jgi:hypothetical protein
MSRKHGRIRQSYSSDRVIRLSYVSTRGTEARIGQVISWDPTSSCVPTNLQPCSTAEHRLSARYRASAISSLLERSEHGVMMVVLKSSGGNNRGSVGDLGLKSQAEKRDVLPRRSTRQRSELAVYHNWAHSTYTTLIAPCPHAR